MNIRLVYQKGFGVFAVVSLALIFGILAIQLLTVAALSTVSGGLDAGFGTGGRVILPITGTNQIGRAVAIQADGKVLLAGYDNWHTSNKNIILARYDSSGHLDTTFGTGGVVTMSLTPESDVVYAVDVQSDGKIVAAGASTESGVSIPAIIRLNSDGTPDPTFGTNGVMTTSLQPTSGFLLNITVLDDGRIVSSGGTEASSGSSEPNSFLLVRVKANGKPDTTLGGTGVITTAISGGNANSWGLAMQSDGKIVLGGYVNHVPVGTDFALARYNPNGTLDSTFGSGGIVTQTIDTSDYGYSVLIQNSGKIILGGKTGDGGMARYNSDGSYDTSFGSNPATNIVTYTVNGYQSTSFSKLTLENNDYIVAVGWVYTPGQLSPPIATVFDRDGLPDTDFGTGGLVTITNETHFASDYAVVVQPDNKIVLAGYIDMDDSTGYEYDMALWRFDYVPPQKTIYLPLVLK